MHIFLDLSNDAAFGHLSGLADGVVDGLGVGGAVGLDDGPGDADEGGAPHLVGVQLGLEGPQPRHHHGGG